jgi:hypothetical protein
MINKRAFLLLMIFFGCSNNKSEQDAESISYQNLIGEWNNISMHVKFHSKNNTDSGEIFKVTPGEWENTLKIKPIRTFFRADSTWNSAHYNLADSLVFNPSGKWWIKRDSLVMMQQFPSTDTVSYFIKIWSDTCRFEAMLDWDMDGKKDDLYTGLQRKVNK